MLRAKNTMNILCATTVILVGMVLITGRKAFQRPITEGVKLLNMIQDMCPTKGVTVA